MGQGAVRCAYGRRVTGSNGEVTVSGGLRCVCHVFTKSVPHRYLLLLAIIHCYSRQLPLPSATHCYLPLLSQPTTSLTRLSNPCASARAAPPASARSDSRAWSALYGLTSNAVTCASAGALRSARIVRLARGGRRHAQARGFAAGGHAAGVARADMAVRVGRAHVAEAPQPISSQRVAQGEMEAKARVYAALRCTSSSIAS